MGATFEVVSIVPFTKDIKIKIESEDGQVELLDFTTEPKNIMSHRIYKGFLTKLPGHGIFVFGSNTEGF